MCQSLTINIISKIFRNCFNLFEHLFLGLLFTNVLRVLQIFINLKIVKKRSSSFISVSYFYFSEITVLFFF